MKKFIKKFGALFLSLALILVIVPVATIFAGCGNKSEGGEEFEEKLEVKASFKTEYYAGEELDVTGGILEYTNEEGNSTYVIVESSMISAFTTETAGSRQMILSYNDLTILIPYTVKHYDLESSALYAKQSVDTGLTYLYIEKTETGFNYFLSWQAVIDSILEQNLDEEFKNINGIENQIKYLSENPELDGCESLNFVNRRIVNYEVIYDLWRSGEQMCSVKIVNETTLEFGYFENGEWNIDGELHKV